MEKRIQIDESTSVIFRIENNRGEWFLKINGFESVVKVGAATVLILMESERNFKAISTGWGKNEK